MTHRVGTFSMSIDDCQKSKVYGPELWSSLVVGETRLGLTLPSHKRTYSSPPGISLYELKDPVHPRIH